MAVELQSMRPQFYLLSAAATLRLQGGTPEHAKFCLLISYVRKRGAAPKGSEEFSILGAAAAKGSPGSTRSQGAEPVPAGEGDVERDRDGNIRGLLRPEDV